MIKKNITKKYLSNKLYQKLGFSKNISSFILNDFFESIISEILKYNKIKITSFGTFEILNKSERLGRNPKTREKAIISSRKVVRFKASTYFKNKLNS